MSTPAMTFSRVSKRYLLQRERAGDLREAFGGLLRRRRREEFWALRDVSFEVQPGEAVGVIGRNGAGKSTTLKILAGIVRPTRGWAEVRGRVTPLIEVGAGFHPDLTGRENVYLNGAVLGLRRREMDARFERIVEFAELADFLDVPLKRYSTGMAMRLGFSVAAHVDPDLLLVDEVLAVGDIAFQAKCLAAIQDLRRNGTTILFVSHAMDTVATLCDRVELLGHGRVTATGTPDEVLPRYRQEVFASNGQLGRGVTRPDTPVRLVDVQLTGPEGEACRLFDTGTHVLIHGRFECAAPVPDAIFHVAIHRADGLLCFATSSFAEGGRLHAIDGTGTFTLTLRDVNLMVGSYLVSVRVGGHNLGRSFDNHEKALGFVIRKTKTTLGAIHLAHEWNIRSGHPAPAATP